MKLITALHNFLLKGIYADFCKICPIHHASL